MLGAGGKRQSASHILEEHEIVDGGDELGVFLYGHKKNAYWYGSELSIAAARKTCALPERHWHAGYFGGFWRALSGA